MASKLFTIKKKIYKKNGHHARPRRASATAPLRTGADMCRIGVGAGSSAGAGKGPDRRQSNHEGTDDQAGRRRLANTDSDGGSLVHAAADTPSKNAATSDTQGNFMRQGGGRRRAAAGSRRNGITTSLQLLATSPTLRLACTDSPYLELLAVKTAAMREGVLCPVYQTCSPDAPLQSKYRKKCVQD